MLPPTSADRAGLLVMAHGAGEEWNQRVASAVGDLRDRIPVAVAFGMADPRTLQAGLDSLQARGVETVAVVRLFVSGASFLHQTEYLFGLRDDPPARAMLGHRPVDGDVLSPLATDARILLDPNGLAGSDQAARILIARAEGEADVPAETGVLLIAHGMGEEDENRDLLDAMERTADAMRERGYAEVRVNALREDWAAARAEAERSIRATAASMAETHRTVLVIPYRVSGFGPYAEVLEGLEYSGTEGFLPHPLITEWIAARATASLCAAGERSPLAPCDASNN